MAHGPDIGGSVKNFRIYGHAQNKRRRRFLPNLHTHRFWVESEKRYVKLRVSRKGLKIVDRDGIDSVLADLREAGERM